MIRLLVALWRWFFPRGIFDFVTAKPGCFSAERRRAHRAYERSGDLGLDHQLRVDLGHRRHLTWKGLLIRSSKSTFLSMPERIDLLFDRLEDEEERSRNR